MHGYLIPCSGGQTIALAKARLFLGRAKTAAPAGPPDRESAFCQLELIDGWWHIEDLHCPQGLKINGCPCKRMRLNPDDEIAIGRHRYRIAYDSPKFPLGRYRSGAPGVKPTSAVTAKTELLRQHLAAQAAGVLARLIPSGGGEDIPIRKPRVTIGRRPPCDIVLKHATVSSRHCQLGLENGYWRVEDLGSHNGIRVDGVRCVASWVLPGVRLSIAEHQFELSYLGQGPEPIADLVESGPRKSLMAKLGVTDRELDQAMSREPLRDSEEPASRRWSLTEDSD